MKTSTLCMIIGGAALSAVGVGSWFYANAPPTMQTGHISPIELPLPVKYAVRDENSKKTIIGDYVFTEAVTIEAAVTDRMTQSIVQNFASLTHHQIPTLISKYKDKAYPAWYDRVPRIVDGLQPSQDFFTYAQQHRLLKADYKRYGQRIAQTYKIAYEGGEISTLPRTQDMKRVAAGLQYMFDKIEKDEGRSPKVLSPKELGELISHSSEILDLPAQDLMNFIAFYAKFDNTKPIMPYQIKVKRK